MRDVVRKGLSLSIAITRRLFAGDSGGWWRWSSLLFLSDFPLVDVVAVVAWVVVVVMVVVVVLPSPSRVTAVSIQ